MIGAGRMASCSCSRIETGHLAKHRRIHTTASTTSCSRGGCCRRRRRVVAEERVGRYGGGGEIAGAADKVGAEAGAERAVDVVGRVVARDPRMVEAVEGAGALVHVVAEHGQQEVAELGGVARRPLVLLGEHFVELPRPQLVDVPQLAAFGEELARVLAAHGDLVGHRAEELDDVRDVVFVARVVLARVRLEQVVAGGQLERHARQAPQVGAGRVAGAEYHFERAVLTRLYVLGEVVIGPAGVAQVGDLHLQLTLVGDHLEDRIEVLALQLGHLLRHARLGGQVGRRRGRLERQWWLAAAAILQVCLWQLVNARVVRRGRLAGRRRCGCGRRRKTGFDSIRRHKWEMRCQR